MPKSVGPYCTAYGCSNARGKDNAVSFHTYPKDSDLRSKWVTAVRRKNFVPSKHAVLCSDHFTVDSFVEHVSGRPLLETAKRKLYPNAVPSIFPAMPEHLQCTPKRRRTVTSEKARRIDFFLTSEPSTSATASNFFEEEKEIKDKPHDLDLSARVSSLEESLKKEKSKVRNLKRRCQRLQKKASMFSAYKRLFEQSRETLAKKQRALKSVRQAKKRIQSKCKRLGSILEELESNSLLQREHLINLKSFYEGDSLKLVKQLTMKGKKVRRFSNEVKTFASALHYYSPRAYEYVRKYFQLPHQATLRSWMANIECRPGFCIPAFEELSRRRKSEQGDNFKVCSLVADEISLKKHIHFESSTSSFFGYVDKGLIHETDETNKATSALVLMAVGLKGYWKIPLAYVLVNGVTGSYLASILKECIIRLHSINVDVASVTCDGTIHNITALEILGATISINKSKPFFKHPSNESRTVSVILDPPHMIKLVRNAWASLKIIEWKGKGQADWNYVERLVELQNAHGLMLANKLTSRHIQFHQQKMKVYLATQVFSKSVADALRFLYHEKIPGFSHRNVLVTADFCDFFNDLFDLFNSRKLFSYGYRAPLKQATMTQWVQFMEQAKTTLLCFATLQDKLVIMTPKKTGFLGFFANIDSLKKLASNLFENEDFEFILTYKLCQDFLELFFNAIRLRNGWNFNPTPYQFKNAFRQLLVHAGSDILHSPPSSTNAQSLDATVQLSLQFISSDDKIRQNVFTDIELDDIMLPDDQHCSNPAMCVICKSVIYYIGGAIVRRLHSIIQCDNCRNCLTDDRLARNLLPTQLVDQKNCLNKSGSGGLKKVSHAVLEILLFTEKLVRISLLTRGLKAQGQKIISKVVEAKSNIFPLSSVCEHFGIENHQLHLIRLIASSFVFIRFKKTAKELSQEKIGRRQLLHRTTIFENL